MYITQCIIAKNEEKNIKYCLSHLKTVVDEQIVVDTGSTDKTVEIAEGLGAKVFHFEWINDFSAARNYALDKAKGDWIIFLDCDEYFSESSVPLILKNIKKASELKNIDGITCELINIDKNKRVLSTVKNISARIYKRKKSLRYRNKVHEVLYNDKNKDLKLKNIDACDYIKIYHTGYDSKEVEEKNKNERNISLLEKELELNPNDSYLNLYLSKQFYMSKKYKESLECANKSLKNIDFSQELNYYCNIYSTIMYAMIPLSVSYDDVKQVFDEAVSKYPDYPDFYRSIGKSALNNGKIDEAIIYLNKCIYCCNNYSRNTESLAIGQIVDTYNDLLIAYIIKKDNIKIVETSVLLLKNDKYNFENITVLIKTLLRQEKAEDIINFLNKIYDYDKVKDKIYLIRASQESKNDIMTNYYKSLLRDNELEMVKSMDID
jgi:glycosyltransferase involved in cell wall biosynthesis